MKDSPQSTQQEMASDVNRILRSEHSRNRTGKLIAVLAIPAIVAVLLFLLWPAEAVPVWQTRAIDQGDMVLTATATGSLEPKSEVSVGAEISGRITQVLVSDNDQVSKGQTLALFDTDELNVALDQAEAQLALARASLAEAEATLKEALAGERRTNELWDRGNAAQADVDAAAAVRQRSEAKVAYARASVRQAQASVLQARTRLEKAVIRSPIDGVVLQRSIEPGSTVAASFQTPVLFLLAEDLSQMELHVSMDEADVGLVEAGQSATFTVDAWSGRQFQARVLKVYLYPNIENNVVTYTTVLSVDNSDGLLKPGMTATATIETGRRENVLRLPNAAFRFTPPSQSGDTGGLFRHPAGGAGNGRSGPSNTVWVLEDGKPERKVVSTGATDGLYTELTGDDLSAGDEVIVGVKQASER
ncbi:RND family efflux transporter MFP subunit [Marinobacter santoriniensis NKSG1]|uniref:RND family efflux transporter MFP subunit n=1 Tax=Marinobacter santoriniensis NKSG1 TaxID=1288826 RepID=M7CU96_9GAMM|nr:efflux RND transporter periplasmic adaptor subunit [Marinobacter santoriniensis]EMP55755.1 RND family efflux transporter MFP subunit [Marinobacter santoriniensis NKSG1]